MASFPQLTEEDFQQFNKILGEVLVKSEASLALIVEKAGHLIHQCGELSSADPTLLATLASNAFNATAFMANLSGEERFSGMYQQGEKFSTLIENVDENCLVVIIFKADLGVGSIKYYASLAIPQIAGQLETAQKRAPGVTFDLTDLDVTNVQAMFRRKEAEATEAATAPEPVAEPAAIVEAAPEPVAAPEPPVEPATPMEPVIAKRTPYIQSVMAGTHWWCACGRSKSQPFCDGSHAGTGLTPMEVVVTQEQKRAFCGCKHSKHPPYCDGSHNKLP